MEQYVKEHEEQLIKKYKLFFDTKIAKEETTVSLTSIRWKEFFLTEIFTEIQRGRRIKKADHLEGDMPYISSSSFNNGVDNFISNIKKVRIFHKCLTLANSGSVGSCYYQPFRFVASDHVTKLYNPKFNKYHYFFLSSMINRFHEKYNFNREINETRILREKILLPVDKQGNPDYDYMEKYAKKIMLQKYRQYLDYISS